MTDIDDLFGDDLQVTYLYQGDDGFDEAIAALFGEDADIEEIVAEEITDSEVVTGEFMTLDDQDALGVQGLLGAAAAGAVAGRTFTPYDLYEVAKSFAEHHIEDKGHPVFDQIREYGENYFSKYTDGSV